ncbi:unnamed protein product [Linum trigynum]|uniref:Transposase n=1 Tax=Linum trigynum TaxID=586398 RepID=A0AAV2DBM6_9ROSI
MDELSFRFVERDGFLKQFMHTVQPLFKIPGRRGIRDDCFHIFLEKKMNLIEFFESKSKGRVSITTDTWTSDNNKNYMCVTAHFVGVDWKLQKKVLSFVPITSHTGNDIAEKIAEILEEWKVKNLFCMTMDNASKNDIVSDCMRRKLKEWGCDLMDGKYLQFRCVAHIINMIVQDRLKVIGGAVDRIWDYVKWVMSSPTRLARFKTAMQFLELDSSKLVCLDVPTRWNSTYIMLEAA